jgi:predicted Zn finger-like uncharacterized protein
MLFTRCPDCDTTFRVTDEVLTKANGQVRCGRCASVFNAYAELHDPTAKSFGPPHPDSRATEQRTETALPSPSPVTPSGVRRDEAEAAAPDAAAASIGATSVADVVTQVNLAAAGEAPSDADQISAKEVDRVLATSLDAPSLHDAPWVSGGERQRRPAGWRWEVAAVLAAITLGAQALHHFRSDVAGHPTFGPWIEGAYAVFGAKITPRWDVHQYEILEWVATAEPSSRGLGSLKITARIQNRGPLRQPYPAVQLRLKDRWEESVGSRMFAPAEYLPLDIPRGRLMSPGETARAEIEVVDPGPDTYGFELDVCIEVEASLVTCGTDEVFL